MTTHLGSCSKLGANFVIFFFIFIGNKTVKMLPRYHIPGYEIT